MKQILLILLLCLSSNAFSFYCADGTAKFRVTFYDQNGATPKFVELKDGENLRAEANFEFGAKRVSKRFDVRVVDMGSTIAFKQETREESFLVEFSKVATGSIVVGGSWHNPNSGVRSEMFPVVDAMYFSSVSGDSVELEDLYQKKMQCWWSGNLATLE